MEFKHSIEVDITRSVDLVLDRISDKNSAKPFLTLCHSNIIANIIFIKYIWYSREKYKFADNLISDLLNAYCALANADSRIFYFYLRSSIENFYKSSTIADDSTQISYYKAEKNFGQLTGSSFNFIWQFKFIKFQYSQFSDSVHSNPKTNRSKTDEYIEDSLNKNDFSSPAILMSSSYDLMNLLHVYADFYLRMPNFEPREDSFYRHKDWLNYFLELLN
ncbi:hypothetical protein [Lacticaseibacillus paracasei]|uniref:Uncharacterized protein n=1 Tax=Lacticaseibacillus paracasei (strain ATCC 334 / BCRC 17002 / CCUG 31169 / CIP 107868 / KCTC 3260 / NRRL B-441) TaxID=321967 RepID=Q036Y7_LACP3|nr:hypothetical protein [Lacticaseibacillus paracasei]ABD83427.1 hypothetical protein Lcas073 [Lacticaseibacillus paracasei ATCC 334]ABJ70735.1 hypothetical protein LSEI_1977 [Lacticaseibacillus paracasei ATCC 334]KRK15744.1 hypothetical protein FC13_GL001115 [Lacticaseibacillus casei DSM 20011 = JCM 1134 = ATCC 393]OSY81104.1 hypothetical protein BLW95_03475 [Lacticaseibacillus paracasei]